MRGTPGEWYQDEYVAGYFDKNGIFEVCVEFLSDEDSDRHAVDVQNGEGYYDSDGKYRSYGKE